jgi:peroxiredoxin
VGDRAPEFAVLRLSGESVSLRDFQGKNVFVHFWATWCPPCLVELPALGRFSARLEQDRFAVLAVCVDRAEPWKIKQFLEAGGYDLPVYLDPGGRIAASFGTLKFPETYVIGSEGKVLRKIIGPGDWDDPSWERILQSLAPRAD